VRNFDAVVVGAGPGGYPAAIRLAQLGKSVALVDKSYLGGTCLNVGCIPSKALIHAGHLYESMAHKAKDMGITCSNLKLDMKALVSWKDSVVQKLTGGVGGLCKRHGIEVFMGTGEFKSSKEIEVTLTEGKKKEILQFDSAIIATGSTVISLPGVTVDGKLIVSSTEALSLTEIPKKLVLIGGGYIGMELGSFFSMIGTEVIVLEYGSQILATVDADMAKPVEKSIIARGGAVHTNFKVEGADVKGNKVFVRGKTSAGEEKTFEADICLMSVGRRPYTESLGLQKAGVKVDAKGFIPVNKSLQTNVTNIYALGDVTNGPALAHRATHESAVAAAHLAGDIHAAVDYKVIPAAIFTDPEIASVGITETEAKQKGLDVKVGKFPFAALGRSLANNNSEGFCKVIGDAKTNDLLGVHIVGPDAGNFIGEAALAIEMGASVEDLALTIHTHPTYPEAIMEASEAYFGHAIHVFQAGHKKPAQAANA